MRRFFCVVLTGVRYIFILWMMAAILLLPSCANFSDKDNEELDTNERVSDSHQNEKSEDDYAKELIKAAFEYEVPSENEPIIDVAGDRTTIRYSSELEKFYIVEFDKNLEFPAMVYYFSHIGEDENFDLATESSEYFNEEMISNAQDIVAKLYGIDCSGAAIHAYGYKNKIAVQLEIKEDQIFQVRFYYKDLDPVGVVFYNDVAAFEKFLETYQAKKYL